MTVADRYGGSVLRRLAVLAVAAMTMSLLPLAGTTFGQEAPDAPEDACPSATTGEAPFTDREDIPEAHRANVDCAYQFDIVAGFTDNTYRPRLAVRRDQMAGFIARTLDGAAVPLPDAAQHEGFGDTSGNTHENDIRRLAAAGIVKGGPLSLDDESYGPSLRTRRDQMASFLMRAAGFAFHGDPDFYDDQGDAESPSFPDVPSSNVHFGNIEAANDNNIAVGHTDGTYRPDNHTRRDQMASFLVRLLNFLGERPADVGLETSPETATVGETVTATATVTNVFEQPVETGTAVDFSFSETVTVITPETETVTETGTPTTRTTDENGEASIQFTSMETGTVTVTACVENALAGQPDICETAEVTFEAGAGGAAVEEQRIGILSASALALLA